jgi:hypothetical protein
VGTSTSAAQFSGKIHRFAAEVAKIPRDTAYSNARIGKATMEGAVAAMAAGGRLSGVGKRGARVAAGYTVYGDNNVKISARGPVWLVDQSNTAHTIAPKKKRGRQGALYGKGYEHPYGGTVSHPGTAGKHQWARARDDVLPPLLRANISRQMHTTALAAFK